MSNETRRNIIRQLDNTGLSARAAANVADSILADNKPDPAQTVRDIHAVLDGEEWNSDHVALVAEILERDGYPVAEPSFEDEEEQS